MKDYIELIAEFDETSSIPFSNNRTEKRLEIIKNMETLIIDNVFNIYNLIKSNTASSNGNIVFCLTLIKLKLYNYKLGYLGTTITDEIFTFLINNTENKSAFIQEYSRFIITLAFSEKHNLSDDQISQLIKYVEIYDINGKDSNNRIDWIHEILLNSYKLKKKDLLGCIIGKCVGDALGFQVEGYGPSVCKKYVEEIVKPVKIPEITRIPGLTFGQYTDDSQLTRELLISIVTAGGVVNADIYAKRMANLFQPGNYRIVGYGKTCATALEAIWNGENYKKTGCTQGHGNGSAMRSAPIGLLYGSCSSQDIIQITKKLSSITHARGRCMAGAAAISLASKFSAACKNIKFNVKKFSSFIANTGDEQLDCIIKMLPDFMNWKPDQVSKYIIDVGLFDGESRWDGISAGVTQTVLWSLYCFCKYPYSYIDCISEAIAVGGDVDTTAAIAGSLSGIRNGIDSIPDIWKCKIHDINEWDYNDLCYLVEEVVKIIPNRIEFLF